MSLHGFPLLSQLTACNSIEDPIERFYLNPLDFECKVGRPLYAVEYLMGMRFGEIDLRMSPNIIYVRSSIKRLFQEGKLVLIPQDEVVNEIFELYSRNSQCKMYDRTCYTEILPHQEYGYRIKPIELDVSLSLISHDGTCHIYPPSLHDMPYFRSKAHPIMATSHAASVVYQAALRKLPVNETKLVVMRSMWYKVPSAFPHRIDWMSLAHPLEKGDLVTQISEPKREEAVPDLVPNTSSSTSYSSLNTDMALQPIRYIQNPGTKRWVKKINKYIDRDIRFANEVLNDKQINSYRNEKGRPYEEVMRTDRSAIKFAPYLRPKPKIRAYDDILIPL